MAKHKDLQPWLDYFEMLRTYMDSGYLEVNVEKHEAYITQPALLTLAGVDRLDERQLNDPGEQLRIMRSMGDVVRRLRTYAGWKAAADPDKDPNDNLGYLSQPFAVNVVKPDPPHDMVQTVLLTTERHWYNLWLLNDHFETIDYE